MRSLILISIGLLIIKPTTLSFEFWLKITNYEKNRLQLKVEILINYLSEHLIHLDYSYIIIDNCY